jgi:hypothetical protein
MKHLIIYTLILLIVIAFMLYKLIEGVINWLLVLTESPERLNSQLNIFSIERLILKRLKI